MFRTLSLSSSLFNTKLNSHHKRYQSTQTTHAQTPHKRILSENSFNTKNYCIIHQKKYSLFCSTCNKDICLLCDKYHRNHYKYDYKDFIPTEKEIHTLKKTIKKYFHDYKMLLNELNFWKKLLDKKIAGFIQNFKNISSYEDVNFVDNFDIDDINFYDSIKFRKIYNSIMPNNSNEVELNNKILKKCRQNNYNEYNNIPFYNNQDFLISKNILNVIISSNDDIHDINKFINCSSMIINYVIELNKKCQNMLNTIQNKKIYQSNTYSGKKENNSNKIIEKFIDFKDYYNNSKSKVNSKLKSFSNNTQKNNALKSFLKNNNQIHSLKTSYSSNNLSKSPINNNSIINYVSNNNSNIIYFKKSKTPKISDKFFKNIEFGNLQNKNSIVDLVLDSSRTIKGNIYLNKTFSVNNSNNRLIRSMKTLDFPELQNSFVKKNNNYLYNNSLEKNLPKINKKIYNLKKNNFIYEFEQKKKEAKTYIHKKLIKPNNINYKEIENKSNNYYGNTNGRLIDNDSFYEGKYNTFNFQKNITNKKNNEIRSSLFKKLKYKRNDKNEEEKKSINLNKNLPKIIKTNIDDKLFIDGNNPLYISLNLTDSECQISIINHITNEIQIICFKKDIYSIPTIIYFDEKKNDIKIGIDAENSGTNKPTQILFNLLKFIGINYDEIIGKKDLWPFTIYKNEITNRPYIKVEYNGQKEKIFYFEDILSMFLQKLFEQFFKKIIIKNKKNIKLYLQLSLPNYLNYLQKKIIEKIFQNNIFSNNIFYNGCNVILEQIKLENSTNVMCLYNELGNVNNYEKNILCIFIDRCSINLSIINKKRMLYEVKGIESAGFGEEDFIDNYICYCLRNLDENIKRKFLQSPLLLYQLRKAIILAKRNFNVLSQIKTDINIPIEVGQNNNNKNISILLKKYDFVQSCDEFYKKISLLIKNILNKSCLTEMDIDDLILIGESAKSPKIKLILYDIFKNNKNINQILLLSDTKEINNEYLISIGCALQAMNNNNLLLSKYIFTDITPFSFGIETLDGLMDIVIQKGKKLPYKNKKLIKINNKNENICVNIYEGDDICVKNNKFITSAILDKYIFKRIDEKDFIEVFVQLEIDCDYDLKCYIFDPKSISRFECLININVVKS